MKNTRLISSAQLALAEVLLQGGDASGALTNALAAQSLFATDKQLDSEWRAWLIAARAAQSAGNKPTSKDYASRAETQRAAFEKLTGAENYQTYSRRPDIQIYLTQLGQLLAPGK